MKKSSAVPWMREQAGPAVVDEMALVKDDHAIVQRDVLEAMRDAQDDAFVAARKVVHEVDDLVLAFRIEAARDFVENQ